MAQPAGQTPQSLPYAPVPNQRRHASRHRLFANELSQALFEFVGQLLPTAQELVVKEDVRKLLERLIRTIEPESRLLSFGSTANGFNLRNSDMDLCCLIDSDERLSASDLVVMLGDLLEKETKFHVKPLPHARIPIVKLSLDPSPGFPSGIACDIGFENRLALENTRLLMCYAMIDPHRVRTIVLFLKVWSKRRKINSPYHGTLSSYGYVLLVIYFLVHVKNPPVLPNLQQIPPLRPVSKASSLLCRTIWLPNLEQEDTHIDGYNTWFFDDIELLCQRWRSSNTETVAELLIDFFRYYSRDFAYSTGVASIRAGLLKKESKGWQNDLSSSKFNDSRERNRFCIEDPFETDFNVARCVTREGLYQIRGEFMRASRILAMRPRALVALSQLCEEKVEDPHTAMPPPIFVPPRLSVPPHGNNNPARSRGPSPSERLSLRPEFLNNGRDSLREPCAAVPALPKHMAPKRSQWTSPPSPEAPASQHAVFENQLGEALVLATSSILAPERNAPGGSSDSPGNVNNSDEESRSGIVETVNPQVQSAGSSRGASPLTAHVSEPRSPSPVGHALPGPEPRGRPQACPVIITNDRDIQPTEQDANVVTCRAEPLRRSQSGPPIRKINSTSWPSTLNVKYPPSSSSSARTSHTHPHFIPGLDTSTVFYETATTNSRFPPIAHLQLDQCNAGESSQVGSLRQLPSSPRNPLQVHILEHPSRQAQHPLQELRGFGADALQAALSVVHLSEAEVHPDNAGAESGGATTKECPTQSLPSLQIHSSIPFVNTFPHTAGAETKTVDCGTSAGESSAVQMIPRPAWTKTRSASHSPFRAGIHQRSLAGSIQGSATSPLHTQRRVTPDKSGSSTPPSTSRSPSPTVSQLHPHEEPPRYSSPLSPMVVKLNGPHFPGLKPFGRRGCNLISPDALPGAVDLAPSSLTK
ncbi:hypothetical protein F5141DRAFT_1212032 [Pisolithus sp. B1]|nr:hypothetical protein F5141DRAFT_1212032 [Pisolithus sp. B1]